MEQTAESFVLAATGGRRTRAEALLAARPELTDDPWAALTLGRGWQGDPNEPGGPRGWAAWVGDWALVERLLGLGVKAEGALAWAAHGSRNPRAPGRDYVAVAELLVAAGSAVTPALLEEAEGPLSAWLEGQSP